jgi:hypothetical protein
MKRELGLLATPTTVKVSSYPQTTFRGDDVILASDVTPNVPGTHTFEWSQDGGKTANILRGITVTTAADARTEHRPGGTQMIRVRFTPKDPTKYAASTSDWITMTVYRLEDIIKRIETLEQP